MKLDASALSIVPPGILFGLIKKKFTKVAKFDVTGAVIDVDRRIDKFELTLTGINNRIQRRGALSEFTDISEILTHKVQKKLKAKSITKFILDIDLTEKKTKTEIWYISENDEPINTVLNDLF